MRWNIEKRATSYEEGFEKLKEHDAYYYNNAKKYMDYYMNGGDIPKEKFFYKYELSKILERVAHIEPRKTIDFFLEKDNWMRYEVREVFFSYLETDISEMEYLFQKLDALKYDKKYFYILLLERMHKSHHDPILYRADNYKKIDFTKKILETEYTALGKYLLTLSQGKIEILEDVLLSEVEASNTFQYLINLLYFHYPEVVERNIDTILFSGRKKQLFHADNATLLLAYDVKKYKPLIEQKLEHFINKKRGDFIYCNFVEKLYEIDESYREIFIKEVEDMLDMLFKRFEEEKVLYRTLKKLKELHGEEKFSHKLKIILKTPIVYTVPLVQFIEEFYPNSKLELLLPHFTKEIKSKRKWERGNRAVCKALELVEFSEHLETIWEFAQKLEVHSQKDIIKLLIKDKVFAFRKVQMLLEKKESKGRYLGYTTLSCLNTPESLTFLYKQYQEEKSDTLREFIKPSIQQKFYTEGLSLDKTKELVKFAKDRKKLDKWKEKLFTQDSLPKLYLIDGKRAISSEMLRFLFYRMKFLDRIEPDIEAKMLLNHIDKSRSNPFAKFILEAYIKGGAKAPQKYLMAMAGVLGDENLVNGLIKIFDEVFESKRMKMAQYVIGTLALIGTDRALRFIELVSRKHKKKNALYEYCIESLEIAAKELGITMFELSDRIIPDFGFDGLYKTLEIEGEEYRIFVAKDFKLRYIDEDNKTKKTLPKKTPKELKKELQLIQKEIREVNKAQKDRLEQYMVVERRWHFEDWQKFYLFNPVMFIYASTLLWAKLDSEKRVEQLFYVDEDSSLLDIEGDEIELEDDDIITIIHPLYLQEEELKSWSELFYELEIEQPFLQLHREIFTIKESEKSKKSLDRYNKKEPTKGGYAIKSFMEKKGYRKEIWDGGSIQFYKEFTSLNIRVDLGVYGMFVGYDEYDNIEIESTYFSYLDKDSRAKIPLKDIPDLVFSEVVAELEALF